jgi:predicted transcriptional regulator
MTQSPEARTPGTEPPSDVHSTAGKLIYVYLTSVSEATVERIANALDLKLIELLPTLRSLQQAGYVERAGDTCRIAN